MKEGWEYKTLGEVCNIYQPKTISKKDCVEEGDYFVYGANGIIGKYNDFNHENSEVLLGCRGSVGCITISAPYSWINGNAMVIHPKNCDLSQKFLAYQLKGVDLSKVISGIAQPQITRQALSPTVIGLPPLSEQQRIVEELDLLNSIIGKKKKQLKELDILAQSIFCEMFGDPIENEKGWVVKPLGKECKNLKYGTSRPACEKGRYKYLRMGNLTINGELDLSNLKTIDIPDDEVEKCIVRYGDILFNRTNSLDLIGKTCMFNLDEPMVIAGYIIRVRLSTNLNPRYISAMFNMPRMKLLLKKMAKGAVNQANINSKELASIQTPIPPITLQQLFASKIEGIEHQKNLIKNSITEVEMLFNSRMNYFFN